MNGQDMHDVPAANEFPVMRAAFLCPNERHDGRPCEHPLVVQRCRTEKPYDTIAYCEGCGRHLVVMFRDARMVKVY